MRKKNKFHFEFKYLILIILTLIVILLATLNATVNDKRELTVPEKIIKDVVVTTQKVIFFPIKFIKSNYNEFIEKNKVYRENKKLKLNIEKYNLIKAENDELKKQINDLNKLLEININISNYKKINATVISRNQGYWYNTLTIDKGSLHGIKNNMAVITNEGLIGKTIKTSYTTCEVKLLSTEDVNNKISIKINSKDKENFGLIKGYDKKENSIIIEGISNTVEIKKGDSVTTSGLGGIFPSGIQIGIVDSIDTDSFDLAKTIRAKLNSNINNLKYVSILKRDDQ